MKSSPIVLLQLLMPDAGGVLANKYFSEAIRMWILIEVGKFVEQTHILPDSVALTYISTVTDYGSPEAREPFIAELRVIKDGETVNVTSKPQLRCCYGAPFGLQHSDTVENILIPHEVATELVLRLERAEEQKIQAGKESRKVRELIQHLSSE